jgi:hypothetical protein
MPLPKDAPLSDWIHDFVHSSNPQFDGKSKAERIKMATGAYYGQHKESIQHALNNVLEAVSADDTMATISTIGTEAPGLQTPAPKYGKKSKKAKMDCSMKESYKPVHLGKLNADKAKNKADWMSKFEDHVVKLNPKHRGKIDWNSATHLHNLGKDHIEAAEQYVRNRTDESVNLVEMSHRKLKDYLAKLGHVLHDPEMSKKKKEKHMEGGKKAFKKLNDSDGVMKTSDEVEEGIKYADLTAHQLHADMAATSAENLRKKILAAGGNPESDPAYREALNKERYHGTDVGRMVQGRRIMRRP